MDPSRRLYQGAMRKAKNGRAMEEHALAATDGAIARPLPSPLPCDKESGIRQRAH